MNITQLKDADQSATYDAIITSAGSVLVAKTETQGCRGCVFDIFALDEHEDIPVLDDASCTTMPRCDSSARTDNRAIIWVRSTEPHTSQCRHS